MSDERLELANELMADFTERTGVSSAAPPRRYLWTDAFAVCNLLGLHSAGGSDAQRELALRLVDQVHHTLGRHRSDDPRSGWISGLDEEEGRSHPTRGGLRIGKPLPERKPDEPYDPRLEWERDGQYFHYLTRWMHALERLSGITGEARPLLWARELALAAHAGFTYTPRAAGPPRMYWKMSIDLSYPLVPSMGQHDPLDGYVTFSVLQTASPPDGSVREGLPDLREPNAEQAVMCERTRLATDDPLGIGGLLVDVYRVARLIDDGQLEHVDLLEDLLDASAVSLNAVARSGALDGPPAYRLAFRELGLAIGLHAVERLTALGRSGAGGFDDARALHARLDGLARWLPLKDEIEAFWREPAHRRTANWMAHEDINAVMLATSLAPDGYLGGKWR